MTDYDTKYGVIHDGGSCKDDYDNINYYTYGKPGNVSIVKLQGPALRAYKAAEARVATRRKPHIKITGIGWRSCDVQRALWLSDSSRYANPDGSKHCRGLAIDVDMGQGKFRLAKIRKALEAEGWHYGVSGEPWHASYHVVG